MDVSLPLKRKCLQHLEFLWRRWKGENIHTSGVLDILPPTLQARLLQATFCKLIEKVINLIYCFLTFPRPSV